MRIRFLLFISLIFIIVFSSCTSSNKIAYLQNAQDTVYNRQMLSTVEAPFQSNDILEITVSSRSKEASADFNRSDVRGYLVGSDGNIELPTLGIVKAEGLTKKQLKESIISKLLAKKLLIEPMVEIRHMNFEITVLGEVGHPSVINVPSEKISLVKALALAGDLTIYGKRDNILLVREENGVKRTRHLNINSSDFLNSEYYYLKPNDLIYVEPNKAKLATSGRAAYIIPMALTGVSFLFLVFDRIIR